MCGQTEEAKLLSCLAVQRPKAATHKSMSRQGYLVVHQPVCACVGAALAYFHHLVKSLQGSQAKLDHTLLHGLRSMSDTVMAKYLWRQGTQSPVVPLTVVLAVQTVALDQVINAPMVSNAAG